MTALGALIVFAVAALYDVLSVYYIRFSTEQRAAATALTSGATYLVGVIGVLAVTRVSPWYILPEMLGLVMGSYFAVRRARVSK